MFITKSHIAATHDIIMAAVSIFIALYLRLGSELSSGDSFFVPSIFIFTSVCAVVFSLLGLYKGVWRYASLQDMIAITKAVTLATIIFIPIMFMYNRMEDFPRSVLVINWLVLLAALGGPRILYRMIKDKSLSLVFRNDPNDKRIAVLLVGISDNAVGFIRETTNRESAEYKVVAIIDNDNNQKGREIHGIKIYGNIASLPKIIKTLKREGRAPQRIILANNERDPDVIKPLLKISEELGFSLAKLPRMSDFSSNIDKLEIKPIAIEDLLGRAPKTPNLGRRKEFIEGKKILITGAGGTIGSELVCQIASYKPKSIILLEISEFNLYKIDSKLSESYPDLEFKSVIGDIRDKNCLESLFVSERPQIIFHAAALKHVPIVEENLVEAALTNIIGSKNIADMCLKYEAEKMVMISTDKAVNPSSLMGVTKRIAEKYIQSLGASSKNKGSNFSTVRFGNVLGSSGSVIPLFQKQLEKGGPITVTHPDMVRYFMTVPEAVELVLQASTLNEAEQKSSILVLDMGQPVNINDMAVQMIKLAGLKPEEDIKIEYTGIRPGEKLYEELFYEYEQKEETLYEGIINANARIDALKEVNGFIKEIEKLCRTYDQYGLLEKLADIVPEYSSKTADKKAA